MEAPGFGEFLERSGMHALRRGVTRTVQVNVTARCNLACHHCHVESGPKRREALDGRAVEQIFRLIENSPDVEHLDLTGGAPEMFEHFRPMVRRARAGGLRVTDRCNLTILFEPGQEDTAEFLAREQVEIVASLPCYTAENVDQQRGKRVFDRSVEALLRLNALGYGKPGSGLALDLVYNPLGASLPPAQAQLEARYREELRSLFGIEFRSLLTITNMPIKRFAHALARDGEYEAYMSLLVSHFNPETVSGLMCRSLVSVGWDGRLYDCDFNQALEIPVPGPARTIWDLESLCELEGEPIATEAHCFGCTAGAGSSCGGALR